MQLQRTDARTARHRANSPDRLVRLHGKSAWPRCVVRGRSVRRRAERRTAARSVRRARLLLRLRLFMPMTGSRTRVCPTDVGADDAHGPCSDGRDKRRGNAVARRVPPVSQISCVATSERKEARRIAAAADGCAVAAQAVIGVNRHACIAQAALHANAAACAGLRVRQQAPADGQADDGITIR